MKEKNRTKEEKVRKDLWFYLITMMIIFVIDHFFKNLLLRSGCFLFICLEYSKNSGAAFSLFAGTYWIKAVLIFLSVIILTIITFFYFRCEKEKQFRIALALIAAGIFSNLLDRIFFGYVIDYFTFSFWRSFPAFNIADLSNCCGIILLLHYLIKKR